jgi:hypothetical protein
MTGTFKIVNPRTEFVRYTGRFMSKDDLQLKGFVALQRYNNKNKRTKYAIDICVDEDLQKRDEFTEMDIYNQTPFFFK